MHTDREFGNTGSASGLVNTSSTTTRLCNAIPATSATVAASGGRRRITRVEPGRSTRSSRSSRRAAGNSAVHMAAAFRR
ncbi:hypothetical protein [Actinoplanes subglobosus]|uniref:Uncharacterized protein n=1 Tax=Actinoplanes subglobosus TaxID=1547892 RepID=A0ABV8IWW2_9ACTN